MNEGRPSRGPGQRGWLERISQALLGEPQDREQLVELLRNAEQRDLLDPDALAMIEGVFGVSEMQVRDVMIPRSQMAVLQEDAAPAEMLPTILERNHSRYPVIGDSRDDVVGILLAKDLLRYFSQESDQPFDVHDYLRPAVFIPESKRLNVLLKEFRDRRNHIAIVVDEYGGVAGLVTIEDVLEQIVGEIEDEHDVEEEHDILQHSDGRYIVKAVTPIDDFNAFFETSYSDEEFDTIGGLVLSRFGHLPKRGESLAFDRFAVRVLRSDKRRIHLLEFEIDDTAPDLADI